MRQELRGFEVECCRGLVKGCPHSLKRTPHLVEEIYSIASASGWERRFEGEGGIPRHHQMLHVGISACPNACARVQIKDIGILVRCEVEVLPSRCTGCGECTSMCREGALELVEEGIHLHGERCLGCGDCTRVCEEGALEMGERYFEVMVGGRLGRHPRFAQTIGRAHSEEEIIYFFSRVVELLDRHRDMPSARALFSLYPLESFRTFLKGEEIGS